MRRRQQDDTGAAQEGAAGRRARGEPVRACAPPNYNSCSVGLISISLIAMWRGRVTM